MNNDWVKDYLMHHGILGQKWGVRRYQNKDGSLTPRGRKRYYDENNILTDKGRKAYYDPDNKLNYEGRKALNNAQASARRRAVAGDVEGAVQSYKDVGSLSGREFSKAGEAVLEDRERNATRVNNELKSVLDYLGNNNDYVAIKGILEEKYRLKRMDETLNTYKKIYDSLDDDHRHENLKYAGEKEREALARIKALEDAASKMFAEMDSRVSEYERTHSKEALAPQKEESLRKAREKGVFNDDFEYGVAEPSFIMQWTDDKKLREYEQYFDMGGKDYFDYLYKTQKAWKYLYFSKPNLN